ncbi:CobW family GTP-binding protein [Pseudomonas sp. KNUC1026]|uniref:CobW family GTP-binding protein n=1 Tax=Pseudomonas sp. KNUC1026 TaxID=2893890 RepID=UPI001F3B8570|nr:CobW-like GTP-binding protein [Pseudomonas sp. KNUC1026]UFH49343.1 CobW-like GTP-binding protein [Pseudomonas sp. KNUC1026]
MLSQITTHLIAGPLGAGKTSLIRQLLAHKPASERWAVLVNEFGQIGLDAALMATDDTGVSIAEVAGGCVCCVNGLPFQVGLGRLLRKARPNRLFIEASGLGHPASLLEQLCQAPWAGVLNVQPLVLVLDALALAQGQLLPEQVQASLPKAGRILLSKVDLLEQSRVVELMAGFAPGLAVSLILESARLEMLPVDMRASVDKPVVALPFGLEMPGPATDMQINQSARHWSIGRCWPAEQLFDCDRLAAALSRWPWVRAKMVIHSRKGWFSSNGIQGQPLVWAPSLWQRDSRLELIFEHSQDAAALSAVLEACLIAPHG